MPQPTAGDLTLPPAGHGRPSSTGAARNSYMWVAIEGSCGGSGNCIIQIGLGRAEPQQTMGWWYAWGRSPLAPGCAGKMNRLPGVTRISDWDAQQVRYTIDHEPSAGLGRWSLRIDGDEKYSINGENICWRHDFADWFGESLNPGSAIGGWPNDHFRAFENRYKLWLEETWYGPFWSAGGPCRIQYAPPYYCNQSSSDALEYWTDH